MDDKLKMMCSSMKTAKNVDGNTKPDISSMKSAKIMDGKFKMKFSSMKSAENVDENTNQTSRPRKSPESVTVWNFRGLLSYLRPLAAIILVRVSLNSAAAASCSTVRCIL